MKKRVWSLLLALLLVAMIPTAAAAGLDSFQSSGAYAEGQFLDVSKEAWYAESVRAAFNFGLMQGSGAGRFNPEGNITVAESLALASRIHNIYEGGDGKFQQGEPWFQVYVDYGAEHGLLDRVSAVDVNRPATRMDFARMLASSVPESALKAINEIPEGSIPDVKDDDDIYMLYRAGVLTGNDDIGTFGPYTNIQRSAVAAIATRVVDPSLRRSFTLEAEDDEADDDDRDEPETDVVDPAIPQGSWSYREGGDLAIEIWIEGNVYHEASYMITTQEDGTKATSMYTRTGTITMDGDEMIIDGETWARDTRLGEKTKDEIFRENVSPFRDGVEDFTYNKDTVGIVKEVQEHRDNQTLPQS